MKNLIFFLSAQAGVQSFQESMDRGCVPDPRPVIFLAMRQQVPAAGGKLLPRCMQYGANAEKAREGWAGIQSMICNYRYLKQDFWNLVVPAWLPSCAGKRCWHEIRL
ncbi:hypothetical protein [Thiolapillus sp.]